MKFTNKTLFLLIFSNAIYSFTKTQETNVENNGRHFINFLEKNQNSERVKNEKELLLKLGK